MARHPPTHQHPEHCSCSAPDRLPTLFECNCHTIKQKHLSMPTTHPDTHTQHNTCVLQTLLPQPNLCCGANGRHPDPPAPNTPQPPFRFIPDTAFNTLPDTAWIQAAACSIATSLCGCCSDAAATLHMLLLQLQRLPLPKRCCAADMPPLLMMLTAHSCWCGRSCSCVAHPLLPVCLTTAQPGA